MSDKKNNGGTKSHDGSTNDGGEVDTRGFLIFNYFLFEERGSHFIGVDIESIDDGIGEGVRVSLLRINDFLIALIAINFFELINVRHDKE